MNIKLISVGKIKEKYLRDGIAEYAKRLGRYCRLSFAQVNDEKTSERASEAEAELVRRREGERILRQIKDGEYVIALSIQGTMRDSLELAEHLDRLGIQGISSIDFVIGGSLGLSQEVLRRADEQLSFSPMTFPHQLMQVILLEQLYRSYRIIHGEPYHK